MSVCELIRTNEDEKWMQALKLCRNFDSYHLPEYHRVAESQHEGTAYLFIFCQESKCAAMPFLIRQICSVQGLQKSLHQDASSVYGYPGVISSVSINDPGAEEFRLSFQNGLTKVLLDLNIVSLFSRLNPLCDSSWLLEGMAEIIPLAQTVVIDLQQSDSEQLKGISKGHLCDIRRANKAGITVAFDHEWVHLDEFVEIYNETMVRNGADDYYFFAREYFEKLIDELGPVLKLIIAKLDDHIVSSAMFLCTDSIIQYHLSGTPRQYLQFAGAKLILDEMRRWGKMNGYKWMQLGGGVGSNQDSLFRFKAGFSKQRPDFCVARTILQPDIYEKLVKERDSWASRLGYVGVGENFFPRYRQPVK